jgi:hypothetical protein
MVADDAKHAFISYVKEDKVEVDRLCRLLDRAGIKYWRDRKDLAPGDAWKAKIREAIRDGSLVFLACFSDRSRGRTKSGMNEELTLAAEEFRQMAPGTTWLIPVRFDDGPVPEWDLGAGRMLSDLNYADLFGEDYAVNAIDLITKVSSTMKIQTQSAELTVSSIESASEAERPLLLRRATKDMITDPNQRIALDDLVKQETAAIVSLLDGPNALPLSRPANVGDDGTRYLLDRVQTLLQAVEPLCWSTQVAGRWAGPETIRTWSSSLKSIAVAGTTLTGGHSDLIDLRALPALCLLTTAAVSAHAERRWDNLRDLVMIPVPQPNRGQVPLVNAVSPWIPFGSYEFIPQILARSERDGSDFDKQAASIAAGRTPKLLTPVSDWLLKVLRPAFADQFTTDAEYEQAFADAETFLGVLSQDAANGSDGTWASSAWYGRSTWTDRYRRGNAVDDLITEFEASGNAWPPLSAGLFGGEAARARQALTAYRENFKRVAREQH